MPGLVDTNILVYRYDYRFATKQARAEQWAYADEHGFDTLWSEDFEDGRLYGRVRARDPFKQAVHDR